VENMGNSTTVKQGNFEKRNFDFKEVREEIKRA